MASLETRIQKLEAEGGADEFARWLNVATENEINERIDELDVPLRAELERSGLDCSALTNAELLPHLKWLLAAENNQVKS